MARKSLFVVLLLLVGSFTAVTPVAAQEEPSTDTTVTRVTIQEDGSAVWEFEVRTRLSSESEVENYKQFQQEVQNNSSKYLSSFKTRMNAVVSSAEESTGRNMSANNFGVSTHIQQAPKQWGVITYRFTWTNFSQIDGNTIMMGDVFGGGFYLSETDTFTVHYPESHSIQRVEPTPDSTSSTSVTWNGPLSFSSGNPMVTTAPASIFTTQTMILIGLVSVLIVAGVYAYLRFYHMEEESEDEEPDEEIEQILTDEERVEKLLRENGGRMKQAQIVESMEDWSKSKVSMLLSKMEDSGSVEKTRIGRENIVELVEEESSDDEQDSK